MSFFEHHHQVAALVEHRVDELEVHEVAVRDVDHIRDQVAHERGGLRAVLGAADAEGLGQELQHVQLHVQAELPSDLAVLAGEGDGPQHIGRDGEDRAVGGDDAFEQGVQVPILPLQGRHLLHQCRDDRQQVIGLHLPHRIRKRRAADAVDGQLRRQPLGPAVVLDGPQAADRGGVEAHQQRGQDGVVMQHTVGMVVPLAQPREEGLEHLDTGQADDRLGGLGGRRTRRRDGKRVRCHRRQ